MDTSTIVMLAAAIVALIVIYWKSPQAAGDGLTATGALIIEIIPRMIAAFTLAGLIQAVVPQEVIVRWMGHGSGAKGILIGMTLGSITPGGPMTPSCSPTPSRSSSARRTSSSRSACCSAAGWSRGCTPRTAGRSRARA